MALALLFGLACGGCSFSYQLDNMFGKSKGDPQSDVTGSIRPTPAPAAEPIANLPEGDMAIARAAVGEVLRRGGKDTSLPWENPKTGSRGTVTPIASAYTQDGITCRDFLASFVRNGSEAWMQGEACQVVQGQWEIRNLKPWQRT